MRDLRQFLESQMGLLRLVYVGVGGPEALEPFVMYLFSVRGDDIEPGEFAEAFRAGLGRPAGDRLMTIAERLIRQGVQQGLQQGVQQGLLEGARGLLLEQLAELFGEVPQEVVARIHAADLIQIRRWSRAVLRASSLDEVFTG